MDPLPSLVDDGLVTPVVGDWSEDKYQLAKCYASIFATSMKHKWECLVYVDLYAGAGRARISDARGKIVPATPLLVLDVPHPFTKYIFCELDPPKLGALQQRIATAYPARDVQFVEGDCNERVDDIAALIPAYSKTYRVLTFCFVDPYNIGSLAFATLDRLARNRQIDFLVLIASGMDANRNRELYLRPEKTAVSRFVGGDTWRSEWPESKLSFGDFVADEFGNAMRRLGYVYDGLASLQLVRSTEKNLALYHLGVFSKHPLGAELWKKCRQSAKAQRSLFG
ncbi:MAG: three-Cys-motif partner protein TcmP [Thermoanaerobaculia bacterium]